MGPQSGSVAAANPWTRHGRLVYAEGYDAKSLDPLLSANTGTGDLSMFLFSYAVRYDERARPVPDALREVPSIANGDVSPDRLTLRYKLRPNVYFHDGVRMTCSGQNALFWNDPAATRAMDDELSTVDPARRKRDFVLEQQRFADDVPSIVLYYRREPEGYNTDLKGYAPSPVLSPFWDPWNYSI